jgi:hypothetical protein
VRDYRADFEVIAHGSPEARGATLLTAERGT